MVDLNTFVGLSGPALAVAASYSPVAKCLFEKVCNAIGMFCEPWLYKKMENAKLEIEQKKESIQLQKGEPIESIPDVTGYRCTPPEHRGLIRMAREAGIQQDNIEAILLEATKTVNEDAKPDNMDDDWIANFFQHARQISDKDMQKLWAKILAGEANTPGKFSKKTPEILKVMTKENSDIFNALCRCSITINHSPILLLGNELDTMSHFDYEKYGIDFNSLMILEDLGLIKKTRKSYGAMTTIKDGVTMNVGFDGMEIIYSDEQLFALYAEKISILTKPLGKMIEVSTGFFSFTKSGEDLCCICEPEYNDEFYMYLIERWMSDGLSPSSLIGARSHGSEFKAE